MIKEFIDLFYQKEQQIKEKLKKEHPGSYKRILQIVLEEISNKKRYEISSEIIHEIDDGDYQGTLIFIIPENCYQPDRYWITKVVYGSCSHCDTLQNIENNGEDYDSVSDEQVKDYFTLALHMLQQLKEV